MNDRRQGNELDALPADLRELPALLTVADVARVLRTTPKAIRSAIARGQIPGVIPRPLGQRRVLILRDVLLRSLTVSVSASPEGRCQ